ncbi:MAG: hypothetical protein CMJ18_22760 [Phycisphaeraceae bacterium]|nr:hypothetical protein [Phycisphaeraceae bacterium]
MASSGTPGTPGNAQLAEPATPAPSAPGFAPWLRLRTVIDLLLGMHRVDFQAASRFVGLKYSSSWWPVKWLRFTWWALRQLLVRIPSSARYLTIAPHVSRTPMWLIDPNPHANHPWANDPSAQLCDEVDAVVIGAGFTGAAVAYHWARRTGDRGDEAPTLAVIEMDDPASGSSGRNEGLVVMGRYYAMVHDTVLHHLHRVRTDLDEDARTRLAGQFAEAYSRSAYRNAEMIERVIREEGFDCDYHRAGWVQAAEPGGEGALERSTAMAKERGFEDWTRIDRDEAGRRSGMCLDNAAGFSIGAASWHPAKWVWCLMTAALARPNVKLYTRTRVVRVEDAGECYRVHTARGTIRARHVVCATESYTPALHPQFHDLIEPLQEQAACGEGGPERMPPYIGLSAAWFFGGRYGKRVLFGSGGPRRADDEAGRNDPSRFLSRFVGAELARYYGPYRLEMTNEWSGTVSYTPDEYPIVGVFDGKRQHIIGGMAGSGSGVSFNAGRCVVNRVLGLTDEPDDYPHAYFGPQRLLDPGGHTWPEVE